MHLHRKCCGCVVVVGVVVGGVVGGVARLVVGGMMGDAFCW